MPALNDTAVEVVYSDSREGWAGLIAAPTIVYVGSAGPRAHRAKSTTSITSPSREVEARFPEYFEDTDWQTAPGEVAVGPIARIMREPSPSGFTYTALRYWIIEESLLVL